ncbi:MAG TPA: TolC family protein [Terracidiphilus sp.]|nr:TolC family protein [Terracidiphilus sp.]
MAVCAGGVPAASAQTAELLTLRQAVQMALGQNPDHAIAKADLDAAKIASKSARLALAPQVNFSEAFTRGNDPVYAFGTLLRQQRFSQSNFELNSLNKPNPLDNFTTRFSGQWQAFDSFRTQRQIASADHMRNAAVELLNRSDQQIAFRVVSAYEGVLLAAKELEVTKHQVETAQALLDASKSRVSAGLAVDSDQLLATANMAERKQDELQAQGDLDTAWAGLEQAVGSQFPADKRTLSPLTERKYDFPALDEAVSEAFKSRTDRKSLAEQAAAQKSGLHAAQSSLGPTVSLFGSWEADRQAFAGSGGNNWMAGAEIRLDILPLVKREQIASARVALERTQAAQASADNEIRMEVTRAWIAHRSAAQRLEVARAAVDAANESLRIVKNRYDAGLVVITELLRAEDAQRRSTAGYWQAVSANTLTWADLQFAIGTLDPMHEELP